VYPPIHSYTIIHACKHTNRYTYSGNGGSDLLGGTGPGGKKGKKGAKDKTSSKGGVDDRKRRGTAELFSRGKKPGKRKQKGRKQKGKSKGRRRG
jgi:hypothetical protein